MKPRASALLWFITVFLLAGCGLHEMRAVEPPGDLPTSFSATMGPTAPTTLTGRWWQAFDDPRLAALIEEAFARNLGLAQAVARLRQADAAQRVAQAPLWPNLDLQGQAKREKSPGIFGDNTGNSYSLSLAANYELDIWQKLRSRARATDLELLATAGEVKSFYLTLSARVADLYYLAAEQRAQLALTDRTIESFAETLKRVEWRYLEGLVPALDVYQARQNLAAAKARRPQFVLGLAQAEHALSVLLGRYPGDLPAGTVVALPDAPQHFDAGLPSRLLTRRPDIEANYLRVRASDARVAAAIAERFPSFNLLANYGRSRTAFATGDITGTFWNLILNAAQPIFDAGRRKAEVDRSEAVFRERLAAYHETVLTAFQEVMDALAANRTTEERIRRLEEQVEATAGALRLSLDRYTAGISDYLPVLTAQAADFNARSQLLAARRQLLADRITLARALGGSWMSAELEQKMAAADKPQNGKIP